MSHGELLFVFFGKGALLKVSLCIENNSYAQAGTVLFLKAVS
jgi:hypothetical protein